MQITFQAMIFPTLATLATLIIRAYRYTGVSSVPHDEPASIRLTLSNGHGRLVMIPQAYDAIAHWSVNKLMLVSLLHLLLA
jgi:hypothetical protein